ncbi:MAG TPA: alpha-amylase family glycosyl hydrolase [Bacteroidales bacterium]|nr:alpha-amylase family glycosyl hydrolase [Bacteroidales bacterium]
MKKFIIPILLLLVPVFGFTQVITTEPFLPTDNEPVIIKFHASQGDKGLMNYSSDDVYAHTGVITDKSTSPGDWKYVKADWTVNTALCKLTKTAANEYELAITPGIRQFYGVPANEKIIQIAFVFRNSTASKTGRDVAGADIFKNVYEAGLQTSFVQPDNRFSFVGEDHLLHISAASRESDSMFLYLENSLVHKTASSLIDTIIQIGDSVRHQMVVIAKNTNQTTSDTLWFLKPGATISKTIQQGITEGISYPSVDSAVFCIYAPGKNRIYLIGDFNDWLPDSKWQLKKDGDRFWIKVGDLTPGKEYSFQYLIDEQIRIADPYSEKILDPVFDKYIPESVYPGLLKYPEGKTTQITGVIQPGKENFNWISTSYEPPQSSNLTIYELLIRDFVSTHDIKDVKTKLDYLQNLGINAIELMPFSEFEGDTSWGYNPSFYFAPDKFYGRDVDFKDFIQECHNRGIAVIMDIVLNHSYGQSPLVRMYYNSATGKPASDNPWYNVNSPNSTYNWGFDFNHESSATKYFVDRVIEYWLNEYKVDGFRFDFTKGFTNTPGDGSAYDASRINNLKRIYDKIKSVNHNAYMICEHFAPNNEEQILSSYGMLLWGNINYNYNEATMGYLANSSLSWASYQARNWSYPGLVSYMESHDEERLMYKNLKYGNQEGNYNIKDRSTALKRMELAGAFFFTIPGPKMIWQFGELGYDFSIDYNGRVGVKPIHWDYMNDPDRMHLYLVWSKLIDLRNKYPVFRTDDYTMTTGNNISAKKIILRDPEGDAIVIGNFGVSETEITPAFTQTGWWHDVMKGDSVNITDVTMSVTLAPGEYRIYTMEKMESVINGSDDNVNEPVKVFPNPARKYLYLKSEAGYGKADIYTITGKRVLTLSTVPEDGSIDISGLSSGLYILKVISGDKTYTTKFVKSSY